MIAVILNNRGNWTLISMLVVVAIIAIAGYVIINGNLSSVDKNSDLVDKESLKKTTYGKSIEKAQGEDCRQRLNQIRTGIQSYKAMSASEDNPPTLKDIGMGVSNTYFYCPVSEEAYQYDPASGTVKCPHSAHSNF